LAALFQRVATLLLGSPQQWQREKRGANATALVIFEER
jgi:hypothetical protein